MENLRVSLIQPDLVWENPKANFAHLADLISQQDQPDLIVLPEMFNTGFAMLPQNNYDTMSGDSIAWMKDQAIKMKSVIVGSVIIKEKEEYYNRLIWMRPNGTYSCYDKKHLFTMGGEHKRFKAGADILIEEVKGWKVMPLICYDLRFPVWSRNEYSGSEFKYDLLLYIASWPNSRTFVWRQLLIARALENQSYVIGVNRVGEDGNKLSYSGDSMLINARGEELAEYHPNQEQAQTFSISRKELDTFRNKFMVAEDWDKFQLL
ncbi:MAG: amidohydrolase [Hyphomicrobiales bacterium]